MTTAPLSTAPSKPLSPAQAALELLRDVTALATRISNLEAPARRK